MKKKRMNIEKNLYRALILNAIVVLLVCLFFEITTKSDDYDQCLILYGAYSGEFSKFTLYTNYVFSFIIYSLLKIFPSISWYYIVQLVLILCANVCMTYIILKVIDVSNVEMLCISILTFCSYEFIVRMTFTKTAGYLIVVGFYMLLFIITEQNRLGVKQAMFVFAALGLIFCGLVIRGPILFPILVIFFAAFLVYIYQSAYQLHVSKIVCFIVATIVVLLCYKCLTHINTQQVYKNEKILEYYSNNNNRASIQDYAIADYDNYSERYNEIGIGQLEYDLWHKYAVYLDTDFWTAERIGEVRGITDIHDSESSVNILKKSLKTLLNYYLSDTSVWIIILLVFFAYMYGVRLCYLFIIGGFTLFDYIYMYMMGRQQHHVEVIIDLCCALIILYCGRNEIKNKRINPIFFIICMILLVNVNYSSISIASYYPGYIQRGISQKEKYDYNLKKMELISSDVSHLYIVDAADTNIFFDAVYTPFQIIPKGKYKNTIKANSYFNTFIDGVLINYNIDNIFEDVTDSNVIYFTYTNRNDISELIEKYICKRYNSGARAIKVKEVEDQVVYRYVSDEDAFVRKQVKNATASKTITNDVKLTKERENLYQLSGYAYIDGFDSYADNIYVQIKNKVTGESQYRIIKNMACDELIYKGKTRGEYSGFCESIVLDNDFNQYSVTLYIEDNGVCYSEKVIL